MKGPPSQLGVLTVAHWSLTGSGCKILSNSFLSTLSQGQPLASATTWVSMVLSAFMVKEARHLLEMSLLNSRAHV